MTTSFTPVPTCVESLTLPCSPWIDLIARQYDGRSGYHTHVNNLR